MERGWFARVLPREYRGSVVDPLGGAPSGGCVPAKVTLSVRHAEIRGKGTFGDLSRALR